MELEISPEPTDDERAAIATALERVVADDPAASPGRWWTAGVRENVEGPMSGS